MRAIALTLLVTAAASSTLAPALGAAQSVQVAQASAGTDAPPPTTTSPAPTVTAPKPAPAQGVELPPGYVIGIQDELDVVVWKDKDMSAEKIVVRPDGKISLPLVNDIDVTGLTVEQARKRITEAASKYVTEPEISVVVKAINSRRVSILGQVGKSGQYALLSRMTVADLISLAGGVAEYADKKNIRIARKENGKTVSLLFNYKEYAQGKQRGLDQNIELQPGDIVTVP